MKQSQFKSTACDAKLTKPVCWSGTEKCQFVMYNVAIRVYKGEHVAIRRVAANVVGVPLASIMAEAEALRLGLEACVLRAWRQVLQSDEKSLIDRLNLVAAQASNCEKSRTNVTMCLEIGMIKCLVAS
ncbi:hypothetical protein M0R45_000440 [Rubus argutus]|uniref:RNase H type-1 domain-containing protein n=1 Tax=Rubus argutus TaxID=59490 RepID=A0AAW1VQ20_RUBAR